MKKNSFVLLSLTILLIPTLFTYAQSINQNPMKDFVLVFLDNTMHQAVDEYYDNPRMYDLYDAKIIDIKPLKESERFSSEIKIQVLTYVGPHNPPYGLETITMVNNFTDIKIIKFEHKDLNSDSLWDISSNSMEMDHHHQSFNQ